MITTLLGDIHGKTTIVHDLIQDPKIPKPIIQLGDFGYMTDLRQIRDIPQSVLMLIGGNHDDYSYISQVKSYLGNHGLIPGTQSTFFCRGAYSIDKGLRTLGINWWLEEELSFLQADQMLNDYEALKPEFVISHDCPESVKVYLDKLLKYPDISTYTGRILEQCLQIHRPKTWVFGHWHQDKDLSIEGTNFICLNIEKYKEFDLP